MNFICPVCGKPLQRKDNLYCDENGHSFDRAKSGYVSLLQSQKSGNHGDDKPMVNARRDFLSAGYYNSLIERVAQICTDEMPFGGVLLDAGCGECSYTLRMYEKLKSAQKNAEVFGIDISKNALAASGKKCIEIQRATASVYKMPFAENSFDMLVSVFSPFCPEEFSRVLKDGGKLLQVFPLRRHLFGLKKAVYDNPYENEPEELNHVDGFTLVTSEEINETILLRSQADIQNLFTMTPYFYKTGKEDKEKLSHYETLETEISFCLALYCKNRQ